MLITLAAEERESRHRESVRNRPRGNQSDNSPSSEENYRLRHPQDFQQRGERDDYDYGVNEGKRGKEVARDDSKGMKIYRYPPAQNGR